MNKVILLGRVGSDPEILIQKNGGKLAKVSIVTNKKWKDKKGEWMEKATWHNVTAWGYSADAIGRVHKGDKILIEGEIEYYTYTDRNGTDRKETKVVASKVTKV